MEIVIGTGNPGKFREYDVLLAEAGVTLLSPDQVGADGVEIIESGDTFIENAEIKALAYAKATGKFALADDSGLRVDALMGEPGVHSARYGGPGLDDAGRRQKLLDALRDVPAEARTARFECVIALADPRTMTCLFGHGICQGRIRWEDADGPEGFGYDAIFEPDGYDLTFAELSKEIKNRISHRGEAVRQILPIIRGLRNEADFL